MRIAGVILAAGSSRRFGEANKLLADLDGKPILSHVLEKAIRLPLQNVIVVINPDDAATAALCDGAGLMTAKNERAAEGIGTSIAAGMELVRYEPAVMIILGDMPFIKGRTLEALLTATSNVPDRAIVAPYCNGRRGNPVIFRRAWFAALTALGGDKGASALVAANKEYLIPVAVDDPGVLADIDAPSDIRALAANRPGG